MNDSEEQNTILDYLKENPERFSSKKRNNRPDPQSQDGREEIRKIISAAQKKKALPKEPTTIPDEVVSVILRDYYDVPTQDLERIKQEHQWSMSAENIVGELLEDYIAATSRKVKSGWVRAYGGVIKSVDFIRKVRGGWELLQIKNRDNSENSSSRSVRDDTDIKKWFRTFSRSGETNWDNFPDETMKKALSESGFRKHISKHLARYKK